MCHRVIIWLIIWTKPMCSVSWLPGSTHPSLGWLSWRGSTRLPGQYLTDERRFWDISVLISEELHVDLLGDRVYQLHLFGSCTPWEWGGLAISCLVYWWFACRMFFTWHWFCGVSGIDGIQSVIKTTFLSSLRYFLSIQMSRHTGSSACSSWSGPLLL